MSNMPNTIVKIKLTEQQGTISLSPHICELNLVIKHPTALPGTDGVEGGGARVINHPLLPSQAPPATVSVSPDSTPNN